jgi:hypothetical protein
MTDKRLVPIVKRNPHLQILKVSCSSGFRANIDHNDLPDPFRCVSVAITINEPETSKNILSCGQTIDLHCVVLASCIFVNNEAPKHPPENIDPICPNPVAGRTENDV